jgi:hypothetical protein
METASLEAVTVLCKHVTRQPVGPFRFQSLCDNDEKFGLGI